MRNHKEYLIRITIYKVSFVSLHSQMNSPIMPTFTDAPWGVRGAAWGCRVFGVFGV